MEYRTSMEDLAPPTVNVRLAAVRKMVTEAKRNGLLSPRGGQQSHRRPQRPAARHTAWELADEGAGK